MFERFTEGARQTVVSATGEARELGHDSIDTEHILLGLLCAKEGLAARIFNQHSVTYADIRDKVILLDGQDEVASVAPQLPFDTRAKQALELALREALVLGHNYIGNEHILLGLVREQEGIAAQLLADMGLSLDPLRAEIVELHELA